MNGLIFDSTMAVHILAGITALIIAPGAMLTAKGRLWHRRCGKAYFWAMAVVALTSTVMALMRSGPFLLLVGVFSFYFAFTGYRAIYVRKPGRTATALDWWALGLVGVGSAGLLFMGAMSLLRGGAEGGVALAFGAIGTIFAVVDTWRFMRPSDDPMAWWFQHMIRMLSAYIATVTAFSVVNFSFMPEMLRWLWPTVVGSAGITLWVTYYRMKFARRRVVQAAH